eukprot:TRINITY_DN14345_c0_g1_i2.p1 TRINITY_DN14345_c0_g1~~TRINITY_DN14345_c0_g1_i2.p1  ORF type:complete len:274 (+),score=35.72 TRINITY_DN14345_c0_g1_i2:680-1501(+)
MRWEAVPAMSRGRDAAAGGRIGRDLYIFGGVGRGADGEVETLSSAEVFRPDIDEWSTMPDMPEPCAGAGLATVEDSVVLCGGENPTQGFMQWSKVRALHVDTAAWTMRAEMIQARSGACVVGVGKHVYVFGGHWSAQEVPTAERYDTEANLWEPLPSMSEHRAYAGAAVLHGMIYVCGGWTGLSFLNTVARFNPESMTWERMPDMLEARAGPAVAALGDYVYVCAGSHYAGPIVGFERLATAERFDSVAGRWEALPTLSAARYRAVAITLTND